MFEFLTQFKRDILLLNLIFFFSLYFLPRTKGLCVMLGVLCTTWQEQHQLLFILFSFQNSLLYHFCRFCRRIPQCPRSWGWLDFCNTTEWNVFSRRFVPSCTRRGKKGSSPPFHQAKTQFYLVNVPTDVLHSCFPFCWKEAFWQKLTKINKLLLLAKANDSIIKYIDGMNISQELF